MASPASVEFSGVAGMIAQSGVSIGLIFGLVFLISGLAFKVSAVPFHMWTPDVYEGAPTPITAYFATAAKVAAMALFLRAILIPFPHAIEQWRQIIIVISVLSMALGAVAALGQKNIKRLMAYSSIGHMGYALLGLAAGTALGVRGVLIYMAIYVFTNLGVFACIQAMRRGGKPVEAIADLAGLARTSPKLALVFSMLFLSLAGLPPLAGFFAKFYIFLAAIQAGLIWPAILGVLASAIGLVYYLRLVKIMYFDDPAPALDARHGDGFARDPGRFRGGGAALHLRRLAGHHGRRCCREGAAALTDWPQGYGLKRFDEIDSTNEEARRLAAAGEIGPVWLTALRQTAGRGRRGRSWEMAGGNLAATLLLRPARPQGEWAQLSFVIAIAAADAMADFAAAHARVALKWPNDVLADGKKLAGILLETGQRPGARAGHRHRGQSGASPRRHRISRHLAGGAERGVPSTDDALAALAAGFAKWYDIWRVRGFEAIREAWLARAMGLGARIRARLATENAPAPSKALTKMAHCLLNEGFGRASVLPAADIFFR